MRINKALLGIALTAALESEQAQAEAAETEVELEHTWYARLTNPAELQHAKTVEKQEQWTVKAPQSDAMRYGGCLRVRCIDDTRYVLTIKNFERNKRGVLEHEFEINQAGFEAVKRISETGMLKTRYSFPIDGTDFAWEIDVFGDPVEGCWVKIDLEVNDPAFQIPDFPLTLSGVVLDHPTKRTPETAKLIEELMQSHFRTPNPYTVDEA